MKNYDRTPSGELKWVKTKTADQYGKLSATVAVTADDAKTFNGKFAPAVESMRIEEAQQRGITPESIEVRYPAKEKTAEDGKKSIEIQCSCAQFFKTRDGEQKENHPFVMTAGENGTDITSDVANGSTGFLVFSWDEPFLGVDKKTFKPYISVPLRLVGVRVSNLIEYKPAVDPKTIQ